MTMRYDRWPDTEGRCPRAVPVGALDGRSPERTRPVYGLVVHTTGATIVDKAIEAGRDPIEYVTAYYANQATSAHYVIGYDGTLYQMTDDRAAAPHVGVSASERQRYLGGLWVGDFPDPLVARWRDAWPEYDSPQHLYPGSTANGVYVGVELPPCGRYVGNRWTAIVDPLAEGLRYTREQHASVSLLAWDVADRWGWPEDWWRDRRGGPRSPRLPGHEDVDLYGRSKNGAGWDPGALRAKPWFDWATVYQHLWFLHFAAWAA